MAVRVDVEDPAVQELHEVIEVVLLAAVAAVSSSSGSRIGQTLVPAVVLADAKQKVTTVIFQCLREELGASMDVVINIRAVTTGGVTALIARKLHQTNLTGTTDGGRIATTLLHGERGEHDGGDSILASILLELVNVRLACSESRARIPGNSRQLLGHDVVNRNIRRVPAGAIKATVQEVDASVGTSGGRDLFNSTAGTACSSRSNLNETTDDTTGLAAAEVAGARGFGRRSRLGGRRGTSGSWGARSLAGVALAHPLRSLRSGFSLASDACVLSNNIVTDNMARSLNGDGEGGEESKERQSKSHGEHLTWNLKRVTRVSWVKGTKTWLKKVENKDEKAFGTGGSIGR